MPKRPEVTNLQILYFDCSAYAIFFSSNFRWYTHNGIEPLPVLSGPRVRLLGPILAIEAVTAEDGGTYKCSASNSGGEASAGINVTQLSIRI